jgi:hypothetical protein
MTTSSYAVAEIYSDLRGQVLGLTWDGAPDVGTAPVAVLMETGYAEAVATLVAVSDGTVSLYFSNGGGIIGAGEHEVVRGVADSFLADAASYTARASPTAEFPLPSRGRVRFYLVTPGGVYTADALEGDLGAERHAFSPLFFRGHELITAIREHAPR